MSLLDDRGLILSTSATAADRAGQVVLTPCCLYTQ